MVDDTRAPQRRRLDRAYRLLAGDRERFDVVRYLWVRPGLTATSDDVAAGLGVDPGRLDEHLEALRGRFVFETDDGWKLLPGANILLKTVLAYGVDERVSIPEFETGSACPECGGSLLASYRDQVATVECSACGVPFFNLAFPPVEAENRPHDGFLAAFERRARTQLRLAAGGVCFWCYGPVASTVEAPDATREKEVHHEAWLHHSCERCGGYINTTVGEALIDHPAVLSFYWDHGIDASNVPCWELAFAMSADALTVVSEEPWRFEVTETLDGDRLELVVDGEVTVTETRRH